MLLDVMLPSLEQKYPDKIFGQQSPQILHCQLSFLWGLPKWNVYTNKPSALDDLKGNIRQEAANIPVDVIQLVNCSSIWNFASTYL
jgi:hypothetical protein